MFRLLSELKTSHEDLYKKVFDKESDGNEKNRLIAKLCSLFFFKGHQDLNSLVLFCSFILDRLEPATTVFQDEEYYCVICQTKMDETTIKNKSYYTTPCGHVFHENCIVNNWFHVRGECPTCRRNIYAPRLQST